MTLTWSGVQDWLRQPTTILGVATIAGTVAEAIDHSMSWAAAAPVIAGGVVAVIWPENSSAKAVVEQTVRDGMAAAAARGTAGTSLALGADLVTVAGLLHPDTPVVAVQTTVTPIAPSAAPAAPAAPVFMPATTKETTP